MAGILDPFAPLGRSLLVKWSILDQPLLFSRTWNWKEISNLGPQLSMVVSRFPEPTWNSVIKIISNEDLILEIQNTIPISQMWVFQISNRCISSSISGLKTQEDTNIFEFLYWTGVSSTPRYLILSIYFKLKFILQITLLYHKHKGGQQSSLLYVKEPISQPPVDNMSQDFACREQMGSSFFGKKIVT